MPNLEKILGKLEGRNLNFNLKQDGTELLEIRTTGKNIDIEIKNKDEFKTLIKELLK